MLVIHILVLPMNKERAKVNMYVNVNTEIITFAVGWLKLITQLEENHIFSFVNME